MTGASIPERINRLFSQHLDPASTGRPDPGPRRIKRSGDRDQVDEAAAVIETLGGEVWAGDVVEIQTDNPEFWNARTFELSYHVDSVCLAEVDDALGAFTFTVLFLAPNQGADVLIIEGDLPQTARAYLGVRGPDALVEELSALRQEYQRAADAQVTYDVRTDGLGAWTAYAARDAGRFWVRHGRSDLVPQTAYGPDGTAYRDASFYYGENLGDAGWILRLLEIGGFGHAFQMEVLTLDKLKFWRRERVPARPAR
ncbi:MAG TPA: hypothetical protein VFX49_02880 [Chloroflexota bacterium]|nr:hypothetical protein [Chloroflexota bacterium]